MHASLISLVTLAVLAAARPLPDHTALQRREVPQEHSHNKYLQVVRTLLQKNNPQNIGDPVFALLGNAAAAQGAGKVTNLDCLQQAVADQAFTNAKAAGDVDGMTGSLVFRALERNTGSVGKASVICNETATNPEVQAITQHQDPASSGAAATNKAIVLALAKQIASVGGNVTQALDSGTFAPGSTSDPTAKGNSCDTQDDTEGCIFSQNLIVFDATPEEVQAAASRVSATTATTATSAATSGTAAAATTSSGSTAAADTEGGDCADGDTSTTDTGDTSNEGTGSTASAVTAAASSASNTTAAAGTIDPSTLGDCSNPEIQFGTGFEGRKEDSYEPVDKTNFAHGSAQQISIITEFMCDNLLNKCGFKQGDATDTACRALQASVGSAKNDGAAADKWNAGFSIATNFATNPLTSDNGTAAATAATSNAASAGSTGSNAAAAATTAAAAVSGNSTATSATASAANVDLGSCGSPKIAFANGLDGRTEASFQAVDQKSFNHGSADNIGIIAAFVCQRLSSTCGAGSDAQTACANGQSAAKAAGGTDGSAADAFNAAFGITTDFAKGASNGLPAASR